MGGLEERFAKIFYPYDETIEHYKSKGVNLPKFEYHPQRLFSLDALRDKVVVQGNMAHLRKLADKGTLIFVPTHSSNMDSIVFGFALERSELPPDTYGAGKNLFTNPLLSFFMHNLGAYKVDRRKQAVLYKQVLKEYATVSMEFGYHNLFFPGGTRCRGSFFRTPRDGAHNVSGP